MYYLVCEGACNAQSVELSATIRRATRTEMGKAGKTVKTTTDMPEPTLVKIRALAHTPHEQSYREPKEGEMYACVKCGHRRVFGL